MSAHTDSPAHGPLNGIRSLAVAGMLALGGALLFASPALAHDELVSSDPAADAVLSEAPTLVTLTFSAELMTGGKGNQVQVLGADGTVVSDGAPITDGATLIQPLLPDLPNGAYRVLWRVLSQDGHTPSAEFAFSVEAAAPAPSATASESPAPSEAPSEEATSAPPPTETPLPVDAPDASSSAPWALVGLLGVTLIGAVVYLLVSRGRRQRETGGIRASQAAALFPDSTGSTPESASDTDR